MKQVNISKYHLKVKVEKMSRKIIKFYFYINKIAQNRY